MNIYITRTLVCDEVSVKFELQTVCSLQGRIYVANKYSTFTKTMSMVGQKLTFSRQITLNVRQKISVWMYNIQISG